MVSHDARVAAVIPCFRTAATICDVLARIGPEVHRIYVVDDACPEQTGQIVDEQCRDPRVTVVRHDSNRGVGGAVCTGYRAALADGADIVLKIDGDGQMDPALVPRLIAPLLDGKADYAKGNRFFAPEQLRPMPPMRLFGNSVLSFISKLTSGYWDIMDPTNGFTAIHRAALTLLPLDRIESRYFFESDMLFRLSTIRAMVRDVPMAARYGGEKSSLRIGKVFFEFPPKYIIRILKRIGYLYFLRDFNVGSLQILAGLPALAFGVSYGGVHWLESLSTGQTAAAGVIMLAAVPTVLGFQLLLGALSFDVANIPRVPLQESGAPEPEGSGERAPQVEDSRATRVVRGRA